MKKIVLHTMLAVGACGIVAVAQTTPPAQTQPGTASTDSEMTAKVRQGLMGDAGVGTAAQHIRVTTKNGMVTLRGRVGTADEKDAAVAKAKQIAGDANVKDEITVSSKKQ